MEVIAFATPAVRATFEVRKKCRVRATSQLRIVEWIKIFYRSQLPLPDGRGL